MGYTHYWRVNPLLDSKQFSGAVSDVKEVLAVMGKMGVKLAGPQGTGPVEIDHERIAFNGVTKCGHQKRELGITWPSSDPKTGGVGTQTKGEWFAGSLLMERTCDGDCSHESFWIERESAERVDENGLCFNFCKTAYKPYDLAVTAALIVLKHHLGKAIKISSDGEDQDWRDGAMICQMVLGYGADFKLHRDE